ncbi:zinc-ribbon domain-containing protein [Candidatus Hodarchaeum mangrovi]
MYCKKCGNQNESTAIFCERCGASLSFKTNTQEINELKKQSNADINSMFPKNKDEIKNVIFLLIGFTIIWVSLLIGLPEYSEYIISSGIVITGWSLLFYLYRQYPEHGIWFLIAGIFVLMTSLMIGIPEYASYTLTVTFFLVGLIFIGRTLTNLRRTP